MKRRNGIVTSPNTTDSGYVSFPAFGYCRPAHVMIECAIMASKLILPFHVFKESRYLSVLSFGVGLVAEDW